MISSRTLLLIFAGALLSVLPLTSQEQPAAAAHMHAQSQSSTPANPAPSATDDSGWHVDLSPYLWFAGAHGTVGALGRDASVHASASDLLSHFNFGLMGAAEARHGHLVLTGDLLWIRLSDSRALPFPGLSAISADARVGQLVWTSKLGYRLIDHKGLKADVTAGGRFWHLGEKLNFNPSILGLNLTASQNWADVLIGGRVELPLGPKATLTALGDVGGWNVSAKLDYQFAGLLGYNICPKWTLLAGYRYLAVDWRSGGSLYYMVTSGAVLGLTFHIK